MNVINNQERLNLYRWVAKSPESCDLLEDSESRGFSGAGERSGTEVETQKFGSFMKKYNGNCMQARNLKKSWEKGRGG